MTMPPPNGRLVPGHDGLELVVTRSLPGSIHDAWEAITDPERTARWIGRWEGTGSPGNTIRVQMGFEPDSPWEDVEITHCDAPHLLRLLSKSDSGSWDLSFELAATGDLCGLKFVQHQISAAEVGEIGPGWEFYLDGLVAAERGDDMPNWDDYFPAQRSYYEERLREVAEAPHHP